MTKRDKIGAWVLVAVFAVLGFILALSLPDGSGAVGSFEDTVLVKQRMKTLNR